MTDSRVRNLIESAKVFQPGINASAVRAAWPSCLDLVALAKIEPVAPRFIMEGLPCGYVTGDLGHGGIGKSQIELMRAVCIAMGIPFCGIECERRKVLYLSCEDRTDVIHWRLTRICAYLGVNLAELKDWLTIVDLVGHESLLYVPDPRTGHAYTAAYGLLDNLIKKHDAELLILDGIADTFGGNENSRSDVKGFINSLLALIPPEGAVILIGHVNKITASSGATTEGYSGSTSWHNSFRARWYLRPEVEQGDDDHSTRTGRLIMELQKANHGAIGTQIVFEWDDSAHLFVGQVVGQSKFDRKHRDREEQRGILLALKSAEFVPAATTGRRTAYHVLSVRPEFPETLLSGKASVRRFWHQIEQLRAIKKIHEGSIRRTDRHYVVTLELTPEGVRACG